MSNNGTEFQPIIDFNRVVVNDISGKPISRDELCFGQILSEHKRVVYDWGYDAVWALAPNGESDKNGRAGIGGERFCEVYDACVGTSADMILMLVASGLNVDVRNYKASDKMSGLSEADMRRMVEEQNIILEAYVKEYDIIPGKITFNGKVICGSEV